LAYEPVLEREKLLLKQVKEMHEFIRETVRKALEAILLKLFVYFMAVALNRTMPKKFSKPDVDGGLIGGAALKVDDFVAIVNAFKIKR
jgi:triosephosphate isomerase